MIINCPRLQVVQTEDRGVYMQYFCLFRYTFSHFFYAFPDWPCVPLTGLSLDVFQSKISSWKLKTHDLGSLYDAIKCRHVKIRVISWCFVVPVFVPTCSVKVSIYHNVTDGKRTGTHSSVPAWQPANVIWLQWVLNYAACICVCG